LFCGEGAADHADLHSIDADIRDHSIDLREDNFGRHWMNGSDAGRILGCDGCQGGHRVPAQRRDRLDICLNTSAAAGIRAGDDQDASDRRCHRNARRISLIEAFHAHSGSISLANAKKPFTRRFALPRKCRRPAAPPVPCRRLPP
jgi:hypothetical protein